MSTAVIGNTSEIHGEDFALGVSKEAQESLKQYNKIYWHYHFPVSRQDDYIIEFYYLVDKWKKETQVASTMIELALHPAYQRIIGIGKKVLPLLFRELEDRPDHWFWALESITGVNPVTPSQRGNIDEMTKAWLTWARETGYEW